MLKLDLSKLKGFIPEDHFAVRQDKLAKAAQMLSASVDRPLPAKKMSGVSFFFRL